MKRSRAIELINETDEDLVRVSPKDAPSPQVDRSFWPEILPPGLARQGELEIPSGGWLFPWRRSLAQVDYAPRLNPDVRALSLSVSLGWWNQSTRHAMSLDAAPSWDVAILDTGSASPRWRVRVRRTADRRVAGFTPQNGGFRFTNCWSDHLPVVTPAFVWNQMIKRCFWPFNRCTFGLRAENRWPLTRAHQGLCGGMVFAVMDYHSHQREVPPSVESPQNPDDPLFLFIKNRLWDSFDIPWGGWRYLVYSSPLYPDDGGFGLRQGFGLLKGRSALSRHVSWPRIRTTIDSGHLCPLGLIQTKTFQISEDHQVLVHGYRVDGDRVDLFVYDPNTGPEEVVLSFNQNPTFPMFEVQRTPPNNSIIHAFFPTERYRLKSPPPEVNQTV